MCVCCDKHDEQRGNKANKVAGSMSDRAQLALSLTSRRTTTDESGARTKQDKQPNELRAQRGTTQHVRIEIENCVDATPQLK